MFRKIHRETTAPETLTRPSTLLKKSLWHRCFPVSLVKFERKPFFTKHRRWLLLDIFRKKMLLEILSLTLSRRSFYMIETSVVKGLKVGQINIHFLAEY